MEQKKKKNNEEVTKKTGECKCNTECHCTDDDKLKAKELEERYLRLQAEYINYRNRTQKEVSEMLKYEGMEFIKKILPVVDNFERAIKLDDNDLSDEVSKFLSGFKIIYGNLNSLFKEFEVAEIDCVGKEFNPHTMEAVITENDASKPTNVVLEVFTKGYKYKDKVIRPAVVKVNN